MRKPLNRITDCALFGVIALALMLTGCAAPQAPTNEYLLMDSEAATVSSPAREAAKGKAAKAASVLIMPIKVADYLAGNDIVLVSRSGEVHRSQQNLWAESLAAQLNRLTLQAMIHRIPSIEWYGQPPLVSSLNRLTIDVDTFYGDLNGNVQISGRWRLLSPTGSLLASKEFVAKGKQEQSGYPALVKSLGRVWFKQVIDPMAASIQSSLAPSLRNPS